MTERSIDDATALALYQSGYWCGECSLDGNDNPVCCGLTDSGVLWEAEAVES